MSLVRSKFLAFSTALSIHGISVTESWATEILKMMALRSLSKTKTIIETAGKKSDPISLILAFLLSHMFNRCVPAVADPGTTTMNASYLRFCPSHCAVHFKRKQIAFGKRDVFDLSLCEPRQSVVRVLERPLKATDVSNGSF